MGTARNRAIQILSDSRVRQLTLNQRVQGSSPCAPINIFRHLAVIVEAGLVAAPRTRKGTPMAEAERPSLCRIEASSAPIMGTPPTLWCHLEHLEPAGSIPEHPDKTSHRAMPADEKVLAPARP